MNLYNDFSGQMYAESTINNGLAVNQGISGVGLITRGFIYDTYAIYLDTTIAAPITTTWAVGSSVSSTTWSDESSLGGYWSEAIQR